MSIADITCVGLLRGVNIGRSARVAMADPCALVEQLGSRRVRTILDSGNVVVAGPRAVYVWCPGGFVDCPVAEAVRRTFGDSATMRNRATVIRLREVTDDPVP